jgi:hypothetical protein
MKKYEEYSLIICMAKRYLLVRNKNTINEKETRDIHVINIMTIWVILLRRCKINK